MKIKNGMKVIAPSGCASYLTAGKEYEVFGINNSCEFYVISDTGQGVVVLLKGSAHLNGGDWIIKQETKPTINIGYEFQLLIEVFEATDNLYAKKKVKRIYNQLKQLAKDNPNDLDLGAEVRKLINN